jgi:hypothetical protein
MSVEAKINKTASEIIQNARNLPIPPKLVDFKLEKTDKGYKTAGKYRCTILGNILESGSFQLELDEKLDILNLKIEEDTTSATGYQTITIMSPKQPLVIEERKIEVHMKNSEARNKVCPILSRATHQIAYCQGRDCMFWSPMADPEYGVCELKEYLKRR